MATKKIIVYVVDVGQGQCTYVEIFDMAGAVMQTLLFDCGTDKRSPTTDANIEFIATRINQMTNKKIDAVFFSHSDNDHVSLMKTLVDETEKLIKTVLPIGRVWYGGAWTKYAKRGFNILNYLKDRNCPADQFFEPTTDRTDYVKGSGFVRSLWTNDEVRVDLLVGNVISDEPAVINLSGTLPTAKTPEPLNRVSLICRVFFNGHDYVICGDATNRSMGKVNTFFSGLRFPFTIMLTVPHHGSRSTSLELFPSGTNPTLTVKTFSRIISAKTLTISAGPKNSHHHPSTELTTIFIPDAIKKPIVQDKNLKYDSHFTAANIDLEMAYYPDGTAVTKAYKTFVTESNVYTTWYYYDVALPNFIYNFHLNKDTDGKINVTPVTMPGSLPAINPHACWLYESDALKNVSMGGLTQLLDDTSAVFTENGSGKFTGATTSESMLATHTVPVEKPPARLQARTSKQPVSTVMVRQMLQLKRFR
ncbi:MAG: ComEC/Rec2 family competence protein [Burkholderiaceae bacterium]